MTRYRHRQLGTLTLYVPGAFALAMLAVGVTGGVPIPWVPVAGILLVVSIVFSTLTVEVDSTHLRWYFGPGLIRKSVPLSDIESSQATRTRWWEGWGIRYTSRGWLYNVAGLDAVLIRTGSGRRFLLGTDEPARLVGALEGSRQ